MSVMVIALILAGVVLCILSFCIPVKQEELQEGTKALAEKTVKEMVSKEVDQARGKIDGIADETVQYAVDKAERSMERISNEKIMAVNEYSDSVLEQINKNHKEVVFLYDMLSDKQEKIKSTVAESDKSIKTLLEQVKDTEVDVRENSFKPFTPEKLDAQGDPVDQPLQRHAQENLLHQEKSVLQENQTALTDEKKAEDSTKGDLLQIDISTKAAGKPKAQNETATKKSRTTAKTQPKTAAKKAAVKNNGKKSIGAGRKTTATPELNLQLDAVGEQPRDINHDRILKLHKAGKSNMAIARELGLGLGEVRLVIDLYEGAGSGV